MKLLGSAYIRK